MKMRASRVEVYVKLLEQKPEVVTMKSGEKSEKVKR